VNPARRYRVIGAVGRGGFGTVYRADVLGERGFTKPVALKLLSAEKAGVDDALGRFRDEARVLGLVRHRAIVNVDALVKLSGRWAVVMEFVDGVDLRTLRRVGTVPLGPALEIVGEIAAALDAAYHQTGPDGRPLQLVHRDIKPGNLRVTAAGDVKVLDFGIARAEYESREARTRMHTLGTPTYMAPERLEGEQAGPKGDVYALGAVLYEILAGKAFGRTSPDQAKHRLLVEAQMAPIRAALGRRSSAIIEFLEWMLAFEPHDRPTAREVERACAKLLRELDDERLREWAARVIPPLILQAPMESDELTGQILTDTIQAQLSAYEDSAPKPSRSRTAPIGPFRRARRRRWLLLVALLSVAVAVGAVGVFAMGAGGLAIGWWVGW
jgi:serine/threonine-protein kinase